MKPNDDVGYLLGKASRFSKARVNQKLLEIGITFPQFIVIKRLYMDNVLNPTPAIIAEQLGYDRPTISGIIERLVKQGFVLRETNPSDRRSHTIVLTEKARELMKKMEIYFEEVCGQILKGFTEDEAKDLKSYLLRIIDNLDEQKEI